ncbi:hypothetical protein K6119_16930 [Paracrocinitomix mangrovi]|uniref:hypothetical protein n=1 Tax=Paracrocinitomix mangrovi TaxID=2862509 RepID=UPI001C8D6A8D|nr:hypothetical protein [Paracrocinitomix mangrovi]UKN01412.1 hypothetical protein K6119_16930 [Paracrocinitomix mangrovi]
MNLKQHLLDRNLKWNWEEIAKYCIKHPESIQDIVNFCMDEEVRIQQNAGAVLGKIVDYDTNVLKPYLNQIVEQLLQNPHDAVKRATMRVFQTAYLDEDYEGELFEFVINALKSPDEAIAIKAFGMTVARRICQKYPELAAELIPRIEILVEQKASAGIVNRGEKELKILRNLAH